MLRLRQSSLAFLAVVLSIGVFVADATSATHWRLTTDETGGAWSFCTHTTELYDSQGNRIEVDQREVQRT